VYLKNSIIRIFKTMVTVCIFMSNNLLNILGAKLKVFGSSCNGFGFRGSDLDICLTFADMSSLAVS